MIKTFEQLLPTEEGDIHEIVSGILAAQKRTASEQQRPLGRGTHTKGVCVRGTFEVFDLTQTIQDPALRTRLSRGLYATPGVYPATIRFANAESTRKPDFTPDVRALSFAVDVPAGVLGPEATRHDFSMNNASTFTINDAHTFAILMRVLEAKGFWGKLKALSTLSPGEFLALLKTGKLAKQQKKNSVRPYQRMRFWSGVAFRHGPDEAIKYSAIAHEDNPAENPARSDNMLGDELLRHLENDTTMSRFDFGVQLLDVEQMRHKGRHRDATFWVENASVDWPESEAPFHIVGRLTLSRESPLTDEECDAFYIDVTEHCSPDSHPLGSVNRARWFAESASRQARLGLAPEASPFSAVVNPAALPAVREGGPKPAPAQTRGTWVGRITVRSLFRFAVWSAVALFGLVTLTGLATMIYLQSSMLPDEPVGQMTYAEQGWPAGLTDEARQNFYYTPQGAGLKDIRYDWFVNLEMPFGTGRFAEPAVLRRFGFLVDEKTEKNPDQLPVGFTKHFDRSMNETLLDITCAACHTGQVQYTNPADGVLRSLRIDGGQANHAFTDAHFGQFLPTMIGAMISTAVNPLKFRRFALKVLGPSHMDAKWKLHRELREVIGILGRVGWTEKVHGLSPTEEGYGRTDALARIANTVFGENLSSVNYAVGNAPVSFPPVWNIWKFDWVQYNASVSQPMARNIGESMGVGAKYALVDRYGRPLPEVERFRSTSRLKDLHSIEQILRKLSPPTWPEEMFGPIDQAKALQGQELFNQYCVQCHGPHLARESLKTRNAPLKGPDEPEWLMRTVCVGDIGTDPNTARNFVNATVDVSSTGLTADELKRGALATWTLWRNREEVRLRKDLADPELSDRHDEFQAALDGLDEFVDNQIKGLDPNRLPVGAALSYMGTMIRLNAYDDMGLSEADRADYDGFGILDTPQIIYAYKPRPLAGIWATAPFLHNGSVPTVYDMLSPASERPKTFRTGSHQFDPVKLGLRADVDDGFWLFDTTKDGNHNTGHEFNTGYVPGPRPSNGIIGPLLLPEQRYAIIEYLKIRNDDRDGPTTPNEPVSATYGSAPCKVQ